MNHSFDIEIAAEHGLHAAILYENIRFWVAKNKANKKNEHDGKYWTFNSATAFKLLFKYMSTAQIRRGIDTLLKAGLIEKGRFNEKNYDRTNWYTVCENDKCIGHQRSMDSSPVTDASVTSDQPIPVINIDIKPDINHASAETASCKSFDWLYTYLKSKELLPLKADKKGCTIFYKHEKERCIELETRFDPRLIIRVWKLCLDDSFWSKQRLSALKWSSYAPKFLEMARMELENITEET